MPFSPSPLTGEGRVRVNFVPPKRKPKSSSKPAPSTAAVRRSIRNLPAIASATAGPQSEIRNRPSRSPLLDTRVIFCGDNLQKLADFPDALTEIDAFFRRSGKSIIALTVKEILDEEIAKKLA